MASGCLGRTNQYTVATMATFRAIRHQYCIWLLVGLFSCTPVIIQAHVTDHQDLSSDSVCTMCVFKSQLQMDNLAFSQAEDLCVASLAPTESRSPSPTLLPGRARARSPPSR
jgi:hypothetical protein